MSIEQQQYQVLQAILAELREIRQTIESNALGISQILQEQTNLLQQIADDLAPAPDTPITISFKESSMLPAEGGNTLVFTGTLSPAGAQYPAGTTFTVTSSDPTVTPTVDATGLIVTIPLPTGFVDNPASPLSIGYASSVFVPNPATGPTSITATITPTVPALTPTGITFVQTT